MQNNIWKGHFEDIRLDPDNGNRDQVSALETARYILEHRDSLPDWRELGPGSDRLGQRKPGRSPIFYRHPGARAEILLLPDGQPHGALRLPERPIR